MKQFTLPFLFGILTIVSSPLSASTVINFDDTTGSPLSLTNEYASSGVLFDQIARAQVFSFNIVPPSAPNYASPFFSTTNPGTIEFVDPTNSAIGATTDSVTFTVVGLSTPPGHPGNFSGATIEALDILGNVIAGQTQVVPGTTSATSNMNLTFNGPIHELLFTQTNGTSGLFPIDDLTFDAVTPTPEPATALLVPFALAGLALLRQRRNAHAS